MLFNFLINGLVNGSMIALVALGFAMVYNTTRIFHIAYAALFTLAGYTTYWLFVLNNLSFLASLVITISIASMVSMGMEYFAYKPLSKRESPPNTLMVSSIGLFILVVNLMVLLFGTDPKIFPHEGIDLDGYSLGNVPGIPAVSFYVNLGLIIAFFLLLKFTRLGIMIRALRDNALMSSVFGVNTFRLRLFLFGLSGALVAIAASFRALDVGVNPQVGLPVFINAFVALVIGGIGRFEGPVIGAFILGLLQSLASYFVDSQWIVLFTFLILVVFIMVKPEGLVPERQRAY